MRKSVHTTALLVIVALLVVSLNGVTVASSYLAADSLVTGPYVDEVIFRVIANQDQRILSLQEGAIEMDTSFFDPVYLSQLDADPDIDIFRALRNGYGHLTINCEKYPLNISGLRRAFAFAFDKTRVTEDKMDGFSIEHDSLVPRPNGWCAEDQFDFHFYTAQPEIGNQILDDLNFTIDTETGFRLAPDGTSFEIIIEFAAGPRFSIVANLGVDALHSLHINAEARAADFNEYLSRLNNHGDYDMIFYAVNFYSNDVDWLAYEYWSENADVYGENPSNFVNETYDSWRDQLLHSIPHEEVFEASTEMQKILQYNVPRLVVYENTYMQGYRNDQFTGHVEDLGKYIAGPWTTRKIHNLDGTFGGAIPIAVDIDFESFNFFETVSSYSAKHYALISDNLYSSLFRQGPDLTPQPDLAENLLIEMHSDNPAVPDGHTRFSIDIIQNATWSDGMPLTADDVAFTYVYQYESAIYGNPAGTELGDLVASFAPDQYRVVLEFSTESYWHFSDFAFDYIIPKHIFN
ncbi:MAG: ABC transporter substrate-binding protein, partial [Candidatus Thorarchaeota archaeon]